MVLINPPDKLKLVILLLALSLLNNLLAMTPMGPDDELDEGGFESSGGGTLIVLEDAPPILLDLHYADPEFKDTFERSNDSRITLMKHAYILGSQAVRHNFFEKLGASDLLEERLNVWRNSSPLTVEIIRRSLKGISWNLTPHHVKTLQKDKNAMGVVYYYKPTGAWLSVPAWNKIGDYSKAGLLIHEAFRHASIKYRGRMTEEDIYKLTSKIMLTAPDKTETLDDPSYYHNNFLILKSIAAQKAKDELFKELVATLQRFKEDSNQIYDKEEFLSIVDSCIETCKTAYEISNASFDLTVLRDGQSNQQSLQFITLLIDELLNYAHRANEINQILAELLIDETTDLDDVVNRVDLFTIIEQYIESKEYPFYWYDFKRKVAIDRIIISLEAYHRRILYFKKKISPDELIVEIMKIVKKKINPNELLTSLMEVKKQSPSMVQGLRQL